MHTPAEAIVRRRFAIPLPTLSNNDGHHAPKCKAISALVDERGENNFILLIANGFSFSNAARAVDAVLQSRSFHRISFSLLGWLPIAGRIEQTGHALS